MSCTLEKICVRSDWSVLFCVQLWYYATPSFRFANGHMWHSAPPTHTHAYTNTPLSPEEGTGRRARSELNYKVTYKDTSRMRIQYLQLQFQVTPTRYIMRFGMDGRGPHVLELEPLFSQTCPVSRGPPLLPSIKKFRAKYVIMTNFCVNKA